MAKRLICTNFHRVRHGVGRHDSVQHTKDLTKAEFLAGPAKQLFAYPGGTCALLIDGRLQCFGLGASVLRKRLRPDEDYRPSYSWVHGFRPENIRYTVEGCPKCAQNQIQ